MIWQGFFAGTFLWNVLAAWRIDCEKYLPTVFAWVSAKCNSKINTVLQSTNLPFFERYRMAVLWYKGTLISPAGTGLREIYSFIYLDNQLKAELTVLRAFRPKPESDAFFCIGKYARDAFCQSVIAEENFFLYRIGCLYDGNLKCISFWFHGNQCKKRHA